MRKPRHIPDGYYAVADPDHPGTITYWRMHTHPKRGQALDPWPAKARYGPTVQRRDIPTAMPEKGEFLRAYWARLGSWRWKVRKEIARNPEAAQMRFSQFSTRCGCCGKVLRDDLSKVLGRGSKCRKGVDQAALAARNTPLIGEAHARHLARTGAS
jgi:hypothetical protein